MQSTLLDNILFSYAVAENRKIMVYRVSVHQSLFEHCKWSCNHHFQMIVHFSHTIAEILLSCIPHSICHYYYQQNSCLKIKQQLLSCSWMTILVQTPSCWVVSTRITEFLYSSTVLTTVYWLLCLLVLFKQRYSCLLK